MSIIALVTATLLACGGDAEDAGMSAPAPQIGVLTIGNITMPASGGRTESVDASRYPTLQAAIDAAAATGATVVRIPEGVFTYTAAPIIRSPLTLRGAGRNTVLKLVGPTGHPVNQGLRIESTLGPRWSAGSGPLAAGQRTFTVDAPPIGLEPGDAVLMLLGTDPYDPNEEIARMFNVVESVAGNVVTVRTGIPEEVPAGARAHQLVKPTSIAEDVTVENLAFDYEDGVVQDQTIVVEHARNVTIRNVVGVRTAGAIEARESENVTIEDVRFERGDRTLHSASGRVIAGWGSRNLVARNVYAVDVDGAAVMLESQMRGVLVEGLYAGSGAGASSAGPAVIHVVGGSTGVQLRGVRVASAVPRPVLYVDQRAETRIDGLALEGRVKGAELARVHGSLEYGGAVYAAERTVTTVIPLRPNMKDARTDLAAGIVKGVRASVSHAGVTGLFLLNAANQGADIARSLAVATAAEIRSGPLTGVGDDYPFNSMAEKHVSVYTDAAVPEGATLTLEIDYFVVDDQKKK